MRRGKRVREALQIKGEGGVQNREGKRKVLEGVKLRGVKYEVKGALKIKGQGECKIERCERKMK